MATRATHQAVETGGVGDRLSHPEREEALRHLRRIRDDQAAARGTIEHLSAPGTRRLGRRVALLWALLAEAFSAFWRRLTDSHKVPGRWWRKLQLLRPFRTLSWWMAVWVLLGGLAALVAFDTPVRQEIVGFITGASNPRPANTFYKDVEGAVKWLAGTVLAAAFGALVATLWHDFIMTPHLTRRIRQRIRQDATGLLRPTLELNQTKVIELDPPFDTVPRETLYEEVLPGALARKKRDVQIVVGEPGAGKTTALIDLASLLARIGLVPILLQVRGESSSKTLYERAEERFKRQIRPLVGSNDEIDRAWRWLCRRQRIAILVDDLDQIGFDGEPGFVMRRMIEDVTSENQTVVVTARPSGVPVGIAASAIAMEKLPFETAVDLVAKPRSREPGANAPTGPSRQRIELWIREGELDEAPLYLEALAELMSVGAQLDLPKDPLPWEGSKRPGRWRPLSEKRRQWNPKWVRYLLLDHFYTGIVQGSVRRALAIDENDRYLSMKALQRAALGMLGATGLEAQAEARLGGKPVKGAELTSAAELNVKLPTRNELKDFISSDDRHLDHDREALLRRRPGLSQHEVIDTGNRLRILEYDVKGTPQFRHRIMQAFLAGRQLAELGKREQERGGRGEARRRVSSDGPIPNVRSFDEWVETLMDRHHPEKMTAHMALMFAAVHADEKSLAEPAKHWDGLAEQIVEHLTEGAKARSSSAYAHALLLAVASGNAGAVVTAADATVEMGEAKDLGPGLAEELDPMGFGDPHERNDPDDRLQKLATAAEIVALVKGPGSDPDGVSNDEQTTDILDLVRETQGAMQWTKFQALPAIAWLGTAGAWAAIWETFTSDADYQVRQRASTQLAENAPGAYRKLRDHVGGRVEHAAYRAANGRDLQRPDDRSRDSQTRERTPLASCLRWDQSCVDSFHALGWVLPSIVSGLGEELQAEYGYEKDPGWCQSDGADGSEADENGAGGEFRHAREQLENFVALAFEAGNYKLQERLAQGFKADAMRHAKSRGGPGQVASNRRLVADVALPLAESWYARMLLYQALALYAIAGKSVEDTLDVLAYELHGTRERHPFARRAAKLSRTALQRARLHRQHWEAFIWDDATEDGGRIPAVLSYSAAALVGDVAVLVDLKDGSSPDRRDNFGDMEELPYCLSSSRDRHEILGAGCPPQCRWGFCPYRATSPDEPATQIGLSRVFCRNERRRVKRRLRRHSWQRIRSKRLREFWEQMEYKARS